MFTFFSKHHLSAILAVLLLNVISHSLEAGECCYPSTCTRCYVGAFGGGLYSNSTHMTQTGTVFFLEAAGGPLAVNARGHAHRSSSGFGGVQLGCAWSQPSCCVECSGWNVTPGAEVEGYWFCDKKRGNLNNPAERQLEGDFSNSFPMNVGVYLFNGMFTLNNCCLGNYSPYGGVGIGAARLSIRNAKSTQLSPFEAGINHFNSGTSDSTWAFVAQIKAGLRYQVCERFHLFAEYRFLYIDSSKYIFGATNYPTHAPTSTWNVNIKDIYYNAFSVGLQFDLY